MSTDAVSFKSAERAMDAHANINAFASVVGVLENGTVYGPTASTAGRTTRRIIELCKTEMQRQYVLREKAMGRMP